MIAARTSVNRSHPPSSAGFRAPAPPLPREHGAWVILGAPLLAVLSGAPPSGFLPPLLLLIATISAFGLQHTLGHILRRRGAVEIAWATAYLAVLSVTSLVLLFVYHLRGLLPFGFLAAAMFGIKIALAVSPSHRRFDRTLWGEFLGTMALTLTGPAAYVVARGALDGMAWRLWALFVLYFTSGVFFVNMLIAAARLRGIPNLPTRWRVGRAHLLYHAALAAAVLSIPWTVGGGAPMLLVLAYAPILVRAVVGWARLAEPRPTLKQVGQRELIYAIWFAGCVAAWLHVKL